MSSMLKAIVTVEEARANLPRLLKQLGRTKAITITKRGRIAAFLVSKDRMEAIIETMTILANSTAMRAITDYETGRSKGKDISCLL
jgi:prevent-host-death family protein